MTVSKFTKAMLYALVSALLLGISWYLQKQIHTTETMSAGYVRSNVFLFLIAITCLGTGIYSYRSYSRRHKEHIADSIFFLFTGIAALIFVIYIVLNYGGIGDTLTKMSYYAANINIAVMSLLPLPFLIRAVILTAYSQKKRIGMGFLVCGVVLALYIVSIVYGGMMQLMYFDDAAVNVVGDATNLVKEMAFQ